MISLEETGRDFKTMSSFGTPFFKCAKRNCPRTVYSSKWSNTLETPPTLFFAIDLLAANCPASVTSVRQLLSRRLSNHTVYGRRFTAFNFARLDRRNSLSTQDAAGRERQEFCSEMRPDALVLRNTRLLVQRDSRSYVLCCSISHRSVERGVAFGSGCG
jgi:hypothetical protein